jgi:hypothetical protein
MCEVEFFFVNSFFHFISLYITQKQHANVKLLRRVEIIAKLITKFKRKNWLENRVEAVSCGNMGKSQLQYQNNKNRLRALFCRALKWNFSLTSHISRRVLLWLHAVARAVRQLGFFLSQHCFYVQPIFGTRFKLWRGICCVLFLREKSKLQGTHKTRKAAHNSSGSLLERDFVSGIWP